MVQAHNILNKMEEEGVWLSSGQIIRTSEGAVFGWGTLPADGSTGWAPGAYFVRPGGTSSITLSYHNTGTLASSTFVPVNVIDSTDLADDIDLGASGTSGSLDIFPTTAARGRTRYTSSDSAGDTITEITNASQAAARTYTIPDAGASANFVMTQGAQILAGALTLTSQNLLMSNPAAQLIPGVTSFSLRNNANNADNLIITDVGVITVRNTITAANQVINSTNAMTFAIGLVNTLLFDDAAISSAANGDTAAVNAFLGTEDGGASTSGNPGQAGGAFSIAAGDGTQGFATENQAGGAGGAFTFTSGAGGAAGLDVAGTANGGAGGAIAFTAGAAGLGGATSGIAGAAGGVTFTTGAGAAGNTDTVGGAFTVVLGAGGGAAAAGNYIITSLPAGASEAAAGVTGISGALWVDTSDTRAIREVA